MTDARPIPIAIFRPHGDGFAPSDTLGGDAQEEGRAVDKAKEFFETELDPEELRRSLDAITESLSVALKSKFDQRFGDFALESFSVGLALSATGKLLMIAEAGIEASVELTFARKSWPLPQ